MRRRLDVKIDGQVISQERNPKYLESVIQENEKIDDEDDTHRIGMGWENGGSVR